MPNGNNTANVGDLVEMEFQGHLILREMGEMDKVGFHKNQVFLKELMILHLIAYIHM